MIQFSPCYNYDILGFVYAQFAQGIRFMLAYAGEEVEERRYNFGPREYRYYIRKVVKC